MMNTVQVQLQLNTHALNVPQSSASITNVLGSITNQQERPGSMGAAWTKKNQSIEINVAGTIGKNAGTTSYGNSGRNTSMNQSQSNLRYQPLKEVAI